MFSKHKLPFEMSGFAYDPREKWDLVLVPGLLTADVRGEYQLPPGRELSGWQKTVSMDKEGRELPYAVKFQWWVFKRD